MNAGIVMAGFEASVHCLKGNPRSIPALKGPCMVCIATIHNSVFLRHLPAISVMIVKVTLR